MIKREDYVSWPQYREFVIAVVDQLDMLDGKEVTPSEKIRAKQNLEQLRVELYTRIEMRKIDKKASKGEEESKAIEDPEKPGPNPSS